MQVVKGLQFKTLDEGLEPTSFKDLLYIFSSSGFYTLISLITYNSFDLCGICFIVRKRWESSFYPPTGCPVFLTLLSNILLIFKFINKEYPCKKYVQLDKGLIQKYIKSGHKSLRRTNNTIFKGTVHKRGK